MSKIVVFGPSGMTGHHVLREALHRGHQVTAVTGDASRAAPSPDRPANRLTIAAGDVTNPESVATLSLGADIVVNAVAPPREPGADPEDALVAAANGLIDGLRPLGEDAPMLIVVGDAGSLEVSPGVRLVDTPGFPDLHRAESLAQATAPEHYRAVVDLAWTVLSPAAVITLGERTGVFRLGDDELVTDADGNSAISAKDLAVAVLDEAESPSHLGRRFTLAY
jgi:putative NADH-flavin reductase